MTGFGSAKANTDSSTIEVTVRSVNGRFLDTRFHLPRELNFLEPELKKIVSENLSRGTLDIFVGRRFSGKGESLKAEINSGLANEWMRAFKALGKSLKIKGQPDVVTIAKLPDVVSFVETEEHLLRDSKEIRKLLKKAVENCNKEKKREGDFLRKDMLGSLSTLEDCVKKMSSLREKANKSLEERYQKKMQARVSELQMDYNRLMQEVVIQLEKADINEELTRLGEHLDNYRRLIESDESQGKKLDFYTQELLREVNTIGSKSQISELTQLVVDAKTSIEKLREQVQNIE